MVSACPTCGIFLDLETGYCVGNEEQDKLCQLCVKLVIQ